MKKQNECLNFFKGLACILVVSLHVRFPVAAIDGPLQCMARFAVPLFFMISGYYCCYDRVEDYKKKIPSKIVHIGKICIISFVFWIIMQFAVYMFGAGEHNIMDLVKSILGLKALLRLLLLNDDPVISILWFLLALLYCYVIYYICAKRNIVQILPKLIIPCLIIHFILGNVGSGLLNWTIDVEYYRNVWFMALPLFSIGHEIKRYQSQISEKIDSSKAFYLIVGGMGLSLVEWGIVGGRQQMYIGSMMMAVGMVVYSIWNSQNYIIKIIAVIGQRYSSVVYVIHIAVGIMLDKMMRIIGLQDAIMYILLKQMMVIVLSVIIAGILVECNKKLLAKRRRTEV